MVLQQSNILLVGTWIHNASWLQYRIALACATLGLMRRFSETGPELETDVGKNTPSKFAFPISRWLTSIKPSTNGENFLLLVWRLSCQEKNQLYEGWLRSQYKTQRRKKCRIHATHHQAASIPLGLFLPRCPVSCIPPLLLALFRMTMGYSEIVSPPGRSYHQCFCLRFLMISWVNFWNGVRRR